MRILYKGIFLKKIIAKSVKNMPPNPVLEKLKNLVFDFKDTIPVVVALRNPNLTESHWKQIKSDIIGQEFDITDPNFLLQNLIDLNV